MVIRVLDPLAEIAKPADRKPIRGVDSLQGKRIGLLWGGHAATVKFWPVFEKVVLEQLGGTAVRLYKNSSWNPAPMEDVRDFAGKVDFAFVGVGA